MESSIRCSNVHYGSSLRGRVEKSHESFYTAKSLMNLMMKSFLKIPGTVNMDEEYEVEEEYVYAERNVLQEEATTVEAETITVDKFRQRFCTHNNTMEKSSSSQINENHESSHPKYKAPPPPPRQRRTSSSSNTFKVCILCTVFENCQKVSFCTRINKKS